MPLRKLLYIQAGDHVIHVSKSCQVRGRCDLHYAVKVSTVYCYLVSVVLVKDADYSCIILINSYYSQIIPE